jgi:hypothetical protein
MNHSKWIPLSTTSGPALLDPNRIFAIEQRGSDVHIYCGHAVWVVSNATETELATMISAARAGLSSDVMVCSSCHVPVEHPAPETLATGLCAICRPFFALESP